MILETFSTLVHDPNHWLFEFLVGGIEEFVTGVLVGALLWPFIKRHIHKDVDKVETHEHGLIQTLDARLGLLEAYNELRYFGMLDGVPQYLPRAKPNVVSVPREGLYPLIKEEA